MMRISGIAGGGQSMQARPLGGNMQTDARSKSIQEQINNTREQIQKLSENEELSPEAKMKKRQEMQKQIADLEQQLRQHQMEQRKEKQSKGSGMDEMLGGNSGTAPKRAGRKGTGMSQASMQAMISADVSMKQVKDQGRVATNMEGRAGVLRAEIKLDSDRGIDVTKKQEELDGLEERMQELDASRIATLADANKELAEASKADAAEKPDKADAAEKAEKADTAGKAEETDNPEKPEGGEAAAKADGTIEAAEQSQTSSLPEGYHSVDIRL